MSTIHQGMAYEQMCAHMLAERGFTNIWITPPSGDQGADIVAYYNGIKYAVQCKYYSKPVGNKAVQEALAGAYYYGCQKAAVMTNTGFTQSAIDLAARTGVELWAGQYYSYPNEHKKTNPFAMLVIIAILGAVLYLLFKYCRDILISLLGFAIFVFFLFNFIVGFFTNNKKK